MTKSENDLPDTPDEIITELRQIKVEHAKQFQFDVHAICGDLRQEQERSGTPSVRLPPQKK